MSCQLPADCFNEIFEYLEEEQFDLYQCLLVNRLWCEVSVRILWRNVVSHPFQMDKEDKEDMLDKSQLYTLISCLPEESKDLLYNNKIISTPNLKTPLFNYVSFCKVLSINNIHYMINNFLSNRQLIDPNNFENIYLLTKEILKMFMSQISSLKELSFKTYDTFNYIYGFYDIVKDINGITFTHFPGAKNCLKDLSELTCIRLHLEEVLSLSFISKFINLQELVISFYEYNSFKDIQYIIFPQLEILKFVNRCPKVEMLIKFLENNGKNLKEFCSHRCDNSLSLSIVKFCPNLRFLYVQFMERETVKMIFDSCQQLESIEVWSDRENLKGKEVLEIVTKHSPKNFHKLRLYESNISELHSEDLESFFIGLNNRVLQKPLSFIIHNVQDDYLFHDDSLEKNDEINRMIEKYKNLGVIKSMNILLVIK
ncbi:hypothetical protein C1645_831055 [Glomus cerebriforme]|uniref:F-box domain-containing protein n=1 Tax=Glomus cerebriforme TaxID=658196 RepID=A0A397SI44_9GLOM|nr:hypothetical protein C1645_831055 [Glomus cerebriforme]